MTDNDPFYQGKRCHSLLIRYLKQVIASAKHRQTQPTCLVWWSCLHYVGPPGLAVDGEAGGGGLDGRHAPRPAHLAPVHALVQGQHRLREGGLGRDRSCEVRVVRRASNEGLRMSMLRILNPPVSNDHNQFNHLTSTYHV